MKAKQAILGVRVVNLSGRLGRSVVWDDDG